MPVATRNSRTRPSLLSPAKLLLCAGLLLPTGGSARGDVFELANGGRAEGRLLQSTDADSSTVVIEMSDGGRLEIPRTMIIRIDRVSAVDAEYEALARSTPDTVAGHLKMAEWCRDRKLRSDAQRHFERVLELDPNQEDARVALGFRQKDGRWMTSDDVNAARGLVPYDGRFIAPQHVELIERQKDIKASQADWANTLERLRRALVGRRADRAADALAEIELISDPMAAEALVAMLDRENDPDLKRLWIKVAARLDHRAAVDALVDLSLFDPEPEIRHECLEYLMRSGRPGLVTPYIRALRNSDNEIINRAAATLGEIGDPDAISPLIDVLVTKHRIKVGDGNPDQHAYTFSPDSGGFSFGGGGGPKFVTQTVRNPNVLSALVSLSGGASFDYDQEQWRRWLAAQARLNAVDVRRDQ